ncbi:hypothetical protein ND16A_0120 [Thalassotalea sp. ND16A]|nr:hypothetical protein ND16A_0120 [Thalassotalea sp. ND16A]
MRILCIFKLASTLLYKLIQFIIHLTNLYTAPAKHRVYKRHIAHYLLATVKIWKYNLSK